MRASFVQLNSELLNVDDNVDRAFHLIGSKPADLIVLPELFNTGYNFRNRNEVMGVAERVPEGPTAQALLDFSKSHETTIVAGIAERKGQSLYNSAVVMRNGKYLGTYRKVHLFYREKKFFKPGHEFKVFNGIGVMVCFDWYFPESARSLMLKGADVIAHPANLVLPHCPEAMKIRALENMVFAVTANRVGVERNLHFIGKSQIVSPWGRVLYRATANKEECVVREIELATARNKNFTSLNNLLHDRFPRAYVR